MKPMRRTLAIVISLVPLFSVACGGSTSGVPNCEGSGSASISSACSSCLTSNCGSEVSTAEGDCGAYDSCVEGCMCSDTACLTGCESKATAQCASDLAAVAACEEKSCASACEG